MWVPHARRVGVGCTFAVGSQGELLTAEETILMSPLLETTPVSGLVVRFVLTSNVRRPSGVVMQPQHSLICWSLSNTYTMAHRLPLDVPGFVTRTAACGAAPALLAK